MTDGDDLLRLAEGVAARAAGDEQIEAYLSHEREFTAKAFDGAIESVSSAEPRGAGIRLVREGRAGFAYTTELSEEGLAVALEAARANAIHATPDDAMALAGAWAEPPAEVDALADPGQAGVSPGRKASFALDLEAATRAADPRVRTVEEAAYSDTDTIVALATSTGIAGVYRRTDAWCYSIAIATESDDTEIGFEFDLARGIDALDSATVARRAAARACGILGARKIPSARMPVVFDPYVAGQFLGVLGTALTGEAVQKGRSLFAGRLEDDVAAPQVSLVDDGRAPGAPGSAPWDAEGVPTQRTDVIDSGALVSFLYDTPSARREGRSSTGNASRGGFKSAPHPAPSNLAFVPTVSSLGDILAAAGDALVVQDFHGVHSGANAVSGDFSVGATGRLLRGGELGQAVKEVTIAAPMLDILMHISAVADDRRWLPFGGSFGGATTLVSEMTVAGT